ncbi:MAG: hypothetical protein AAF945_01025 [Actinomycetota bacterium]
MRISRRPDRETGRGVDDDHVGTWIASDDGDRTIATATATRRADDRIFVRFEGDEADVDGWFERLLRSAMEEIDEPICVTVRRDEEHRHQVTRRLGLRAELTSVKYDVAFETALRSLDRLATSTRWRIVSADEVDRDDLFHLDAELRGDTPGNDGWAGARNRFDDEMAAPEYDPTGYHVAVDPSTGRLVGLCRMWRNLDRPSLGLLGVVVEHRNGRLAWELLRTTLAGAADWGWLNFDFHTARPGLQRHAGRLGATVSGGFTRYVGN